MRKNSKILILFFILALFPGGWQGAAATTGTDKELIIPAVADGTQPLPAVVRFCCQINQRLSAAGVRVWKQPLLLNFSLTAPWPESLQTPPGLLTPRQALRERHNLVRVRDGRLSLNQAFKKILADGRDAAPKLTGRYGNAYDLAAGLVIEPLLLRDDQRRGKKALLRSAAFLQTAGWDRRFWGGVSFQNKNFRRSPDPAEASNPRIFFAVNAAHFFLDPEYAQRRPTLFAWFRSVYGDPFPAHSKKVNTLVFLGSRHLLVDVDPSRLCAVHYLLASPGSDLVSGFGHSMVRLILRPPESTAENDGMQAVQEHLVFAYQALTLGDLSIDHIGGLLGKYPSQEFCYLFSTVQSRYVAGEFRELRSMPVLFNETEKKLFLYRLLERYWQYSGRYRFLSRNCATEIRDDIQSVLPSAHAFRHQHPRSPAGIARSMNRYGLVDRRIFNDLTAARRRGLYFPYSRLVETAYKRRIVPIIPWYRRGWQKHWLQSSTAADRRLVYQAWAQDPTDARAAAADFYALEKRAELLAYADLVKAALRLLKHEIRRQGKLANSFYRAEALIRQRMPWNLLPPDSGYGIPLTREMARLPPLAELQRRDREMAQLKQTVIAVLRRQQPRLYARYQEARKAARFYLTAMRKQPSSH